MILKWVSEKLSKINSILEFGIIITILSAFTILFIYMCKIIILTLYKIPLSLTLKIVDVNTTDFIITYTLSLVAIALSIPYYHFIYDTKGRKKIKNIIYMIIILIVFLINIFIRFRNQGFLLYELIYTAFSLFLAIIILHITIWGLKPNKIKKFFMKKTFAGKDEFKKIYTAFYEFMYIMLILTVIAGAFANLFIFLPMQRPLANDKLILYSSADNFLVVDYWLINDEKLGKYIEFDYNSMQLISKEGVILNSTEYIHLVPLDKSQ